MISVGVYLRISSDKTGERLGVERQEADCRALCARRGWDVAEVYADNDASAYSGKPRPHYERLLADIKAGNINAVVAYHPDRLHRSPKELERFIDLAESAGLVVETVKAGTVDLSTPSGRAVARTLGAWARFESEHKSTRIKSKLDQNAATGRPHGGMRPYGWEVDKRTLREHEAAVVREGTERVLAGEPIRSVFRDLNARRLFNASGRPWTHATFRGILLRERNAGLRIHRGVVVGTGDWQPIVIPETFRALQRVVEDPSRVTTPGRGGRLHLLSGLAACSVCGSAVHTGHSRSAMAYRCPQHHVVRTQHLLDRYVTAVVVERLSRPDAIELLSPPDDAGARRQAAAMAERVRERFDEAAAAFAAGEITARQLTTITAKLRPELADLEMRAAPPPERERLLGDVVGQDDVAGRWERLSTDVQRAVIALLMEIRVGRGRRGPGFSPEGIEIKWKGSTP